MQPSPAKILAHTVFSTKDRQPLLRDKMLREELDLYLGGILAGIDCQPLIVGGMPDHVHFLCALSYNRSAADMVREIKQRSAIWLKGKSPDLKDFAWQNGCGIFSVGFSQIDKVRAYIAGQEGHHRKVSFQDEFRELLRRYNVPCDEGNVWD